MSFDAIGSVPKGLSFNSTEDLSKKKAGFQLGFCQILSWNLFPKEKVNICFTYYHVSLEMAKLRHFHC